MSISATRRIVMVACLVGLLGAWTAGQAATSTNWNFDADTVGAAPPGWDIYYVDPTIGATTAVSTAQSASPNNSIEMRKTNDYNHIDYFGRTDLASYFPSASNTVIMYKARFTHTDVQLRMNIIYSTGHTLATVKFYGGTIYAQYGAAANQTPLGIFAANTWYTIVMSTRPATTNFSVWALKDNIVIGSATNLPYRETGFAPQGLWFIYDGWITVGKTGPSSMFVDDVFVGPSSPPPDTVTFDFDTDTVGQIPPGWPYTYIQPYAGSTIQVSSAQSTTPGNSLELRSFADVTAGPDVIQRTDLGWYLPSSRDNLFAFHTRFPATDLQLRVHLLDQNQTSCNQIKFNGGQVIAQSGPSYTETVVGTFVPNAWYEVQISSVPANNTYSINLVSNGVRIGSALNQAYTQNGLVPVGLSFVSDGWLTLGKTAQNSIFLDHITVGPTPLPPRGTVMLLR